MQVSTPLLVLLTIGACEGRRSSYSSNSSLDTEAGLSPLIWVPGITSSALEAYHRKEEAFDHDWCYATVPDDKWFELYVSAKQASNTPCLLYALHLEVPKKQDLDALPIDSITLDATAPPPDSCVADAHGFEIRAIGFGLAKGNAILNPGDLIPFKLYEAMIQMFEAMGHERDRSVKFASYDWRKYGDPCWEMQWWKKLKKLVEDSVEDMGERATLGCHSMGCPLVHQFLNLPFITKDWKKQYVKEFIATGPAFAGGAMVMQNFIQGPSYAMMPLAISHFTRAPMASMPGFHTLMPAPGLGAWPEDFVFVETPWKNYTIASIVDGSFFDDVEDLQRPRGLRKELADEIISIQEQKKHSQDKAPTDQEVNGTDIDGQVVTAKACICRSDSPCSNLNEGIGGLVEQGITHEQPWCYTLGECGTKGWTSAIQGWWDYCGGDAKTMDAGPGFEFFPGVNTKKSSLFTHIFGKDESYEQVTGAQIEEIKLKCLEDPACTGFDMEGWLKLSARAPKHDEMLGTTWRGTTRAVNGRIQGLYVKRKKVHQCQHSCDGEEGEVCGSDGKTYVSRCHLNNAACWNKDLQVSRDSRCESRISSDQGCDCKSNCGVTHRILSSLPMANQRWCWTKGDCGTKNPVSFIRSSYFDTCMGGESIDTQRGFDYLARTSLRFTAAFPESSVVLRAAEWPYSFESLEAICGEDSTCAGFTTGGILLAHGFNKPEKWSQPSDTALGIYRKQAGVVRCQRDCSQDAKSAVCMVDSKKTYANACEAENAGCLLGGREAAKYVSGTCRRLGNSGMHQFAKNWAIRASKLKPPGVPTTCMYITDVQTEQAWKFESDFTQKGKTLSYSGGDGTVNIQSMEGPCKKWQQEQEEPVKLAPLALGGASHVTMLMDNGFNKALKEVLTGTYAF